MCRNMQKMDWNTSLPLRMDSIFRSRSRRDMGDEDDEDNMQAIDIEDSGMHGW